MYRYMNSLRVLSGSVPVCLNTECTRCVLISVHAHARDSADTMPMEGDIYTFFLSIILVAALLFWARDLGKEEPQTQKKKTCTTTYWRQMI